NEDRRVWYAMLITSVQNELKAANEPRIAVPDVINFKAIFMQTQSRFVWMLRTVTQPRPARVRFPGVNFRSASTPTRTAYPVAIGGCELGNGEHETVHVIGVFLRRFIEHVQPHLAPNRRYLRRHGR